MMNKIQQFFKKNYKEIIFSLLLAALVLFPYILNDWVNMEHDTFFHISRIEGLATALKNNDFIPRIYTYKNMNFGYASPLFYSDFFLLIPSILYNLGMSLALVYKILLFVTNFLSCYFMIQLIKRFTKNIYSPFIGGALYLFANYHLTDIYVRGALGEVMGFIFLPIAIMGIYDVLCSDEMKYHNLVIAFTCLILTHNISFALCCIMFLGFIILYFKNIIENPKRIFQIIKAVVIVIGLSAFFTLPMLEQLTSQRFYLNSFADSMDMETYTMNAWAFFAYKTVFSTGSSVTPIESTMLMNLGYLVPLLPICGLFILDKPKTKEMDFIKKATILGYFFFIIPWSIIPWKYISFLRVIQFPWRFEMIALVLLCIPASIYIFNLFKKKQDFITIGLIVCIIGGGIYHLLPVDNRPTNITSKTTYANILDGSIIDPFYSAFYVRVEVAGADYLPEGSPDYTTLSKAITDESWNVISNDVVKGYNTLSFTVNAPNQTLILPLTYYKGYNVYEIDNEGNEHKLDTFAKNTLVSFTSTTSTNYICKYDGTLIQKASVFISLLTLIAVITINILNKKKHRTV